MTRLKTEDIEGIGADLVRCDRQLQIMTGSALFDLARLAAGVSPEKIIPAPRDCRVAAIPISGGQGLIGGFTKAIEAIVTHLGFQTCAIRHPDAAGLAEAYEQKADILILADDVRFVSIHTGTRRVFDNCELTGAAFATVLHLMAGGLAGKPCLVLGCGPVGKAAARTLLRRGARVSVCDTVIERAQLLREQLECDHPGAVVVEPDPKAAIRRHRAILDATPAAAVIDAEDLQPDAVVSAPGVPHGLTEAAARRIRNRFYHDPLQLGVTSMVVAALASVHGPECSIL